MAEFKISTLAVPTVVVLILFLSYSSQVLFLKIEPGPLSQRQVVQFNLLVALLWICYIRACRVDPGRVPEEWTLKNHATTQAVDSPEAIARQRRCRKCEAFKPPRSHHCKACRRCIPKMDHHCPWTSNCVSHFTFPHFLRFLIYAVWAMAYLEYFIFLRLAVLWNNRHKPSYLGPTTGQLVHLFILVLANTLLLFMVGTMLVRTVWSLGGNVTTIESWEIERHAQLLRRARVLGGYLDGPDGIRIRMKKQEFPYDIGIWQNIKQGMGSGLFITWLWPFATTPRTDGLEFETNHFEDESMTWPPPDPDRIPRLQRQINPDEAFTYPSTPLSTYDEVQAFKMRQEADIRRRKAFHDRHFDSSSLRELYDLETVSDNDESGEEGWMDSGGNRLKDYGVDEEVEFYDEDDIPLSELLRHRKAKSA